VKLPPFQSLLEAHGEEIYRFLMASVGGNDAEDCFQDTFMAALGAYPELLDATNLKGWLFTIAHRKAIHHRPPQSHRLSSPAADFRRPARQPS